MKKMTRLYPLFGLIEKLKINYLHNRNEQPILVYQMGKVGSTTISKTLSNLNIKNSIYHVHYLSKHRIDEAIVEYKNLKTSVVPMHLRRSKYLANKFNFKEDKIKIITLTREPIARIISGFFQNISYFSPEVVHGYNTIDSDLAFKKVKNNIINYDINSEDAATWFDREFKEALGIDIYNFEFPKEKGYQIIKKNNIECLIIKMEKLNDIGIKAISEFLSINENSKLEHTNIGSEKEFALDQKKLKNDLHFDEQILQYIYSSKYMKHFYTDEEISSYIKKWM